MKVCITGGNGFLGSSISRELLQRGHELVAFVQHGQSIDTISNQPIKIFYGDLLYYPSILPAIGGCDAIIHTAAITSLWPYRSDFQKKVNIEGTINLMNAALECKTPKIIHIGTANSFGSGDKNNPGNEEKSYDAGKYKLDYMDTKYEAQKKVMEMVATQGLPAVILNPTFMFGPFGGKWGSTQMLLAVYHKKSPGYTKGGRNYISVKDVAVAVANALDKGKIGECYILGNENLSYKEIFEKIAGIAGVKAPGLYVPPFASKAFGLIQTLIGKTFGINPIVNYRMALMSNDEHYYSAQKAVKELGLPQTPITEAIKEAFDYLRDKKIIG